MSLLRATIEPGMWQLADVLVIYLQTLCGFDVDSVYVLWYFERTNYTYVIYFRV